MAMQNGLKSAIEELTHQPQTVPVIDQAAIDLLQAELYYLNDQNSESVSIFDAKLIPILKQLPDEIQIVILHNKNIASFGTLNPNSASDFYYLYDYRKLSGLKPWNSNDLLMAHNAVEEGRHYDALPKYWQNLLYTFNQGIWNAYADACALLSKELIALNWLPKAAYYAILSQDTKLADIICRCLIGSRNVGLIEQTLDTILVKSQLLKHASVTCKMIKGIQDEIPDTYLDIAVDYLLGICSNKRQNLLEINPIVNAWEAIKSLTHRLSPHKACKLLDIITEHEWFNSVSINRRHLIDVVDSLIDVLPKNRLMDLSKITIPFAKEKKLDFDYTNVINLLLHIAFQDKSKSKKYLTKQLYSKGTKIDSVLGQVVKDFGGKIKFDDPGDAVKKVSHNILLQVQHLKPKEEPQKVFDTYGNISKIDKDKKEKTVVQMSANSHLKTLTANKHLLNLSHINMLVDAFVSMIEEPDNLLSNKMGFINAVIELADKLTRKQKQILFGVLEPLASGSVIEGSVGMSHKEASNPLNPFKMNDTKPEEISGYALYALACLENSNPGIYGDKLNKLVEKALIDKNPIIRKYGYWAVARISKLNSELLASVFYGTRDSDYQTTMAAFDFISERKDIKLSLIHWRLLFLSLYEAAHSEHKELRRISAIISNKLCNKAPLEYKNKIKELTKKLKSDICYSVRVLPKHS
jgi:hypothetical protein